jgi:formylglycine-generating enzyme required for sulfatase activity
MMLLCHHLQAQKHHQSKDIANHFVRVEPNLYACKFETSNADYRAFFNDIVQRRPELKYNLMLDSSKWENNKRKHAKLQKKYASAAKYAAYPVVNISYEQANFYCNWLTQMYHLDPNRPFKKVVFRLPTKNEWNKAVYGQNSLDSFPWSGSFNDKPKRFNIHLKGRWQPYVKKVNAKKYRQAPLQLYHALGNVSEMVSSKGECVGGNFASHPYYFGKNSQNEFYPAYVPCPLVGFRVFMQVMVE